MTEKKFDPKKLAKLNNPERLKDIPPQYVWEKLNTENPQVLVEIGAGTAFFSLAFLQHSKAAKLYACDVSEVMIEWMNENVVPKFPGIIPVKTEENSIPLDDGIADVVFMLNLHHELDNPARILEEANRILKDCGKIFIVDWKKEDMADGPPAHIRYAPERVREQMAKAGFKGIEISTGLSKHFLLVGHKGLKCQ